MATRFSVSLAHAACDHTGFVVWEERERADAPGAGSPVMVGLPRGFVSLNSEEGVIEIVCAGCRQTVASAARSEVSGGGAAVELVVAAPAVAAPTVAAPTVAAPVVTAPTVAAPAAAAPAIAAPAIAAPAIAAPATPAGDAAAQQPTAPGATIAVAATGQGVAVPAAAAVALAAPGSVASADATAGDSADASTEDKVRADIEALFAEAEDVAPIRGDAIPQHLLDKLRHLADRMRQRRE